MSIAAFEEGKALLSQIASGDRIAFSRFYSIQLHSLYRYIYLFTKSKDDTEEILQEVFIKVWESREKLPGLESPAAYIQQIARNKIIDRVRKTQLRHRVMSEIRRSRNVYDAATADDCAFKEYYKVVQQAIEKLPQKRKVIFRMNIENGLSQEEIAEQLKISKSVVQKQLYSATHFVRKYLFEHGEISLSLAGILFTL